MSQTASHSVFGSLDSRGFQIKVRDDESKVVSYRDASNLGQDTPSVPKELSGYDDARVAELPGRGAILDGESGQGTQPLLYGCAG